MPATTAPREAGDSHPFFPVTREMVHEAIDNLIDRMPSGSREQSVFMIELWTVRLYAGRAVAIGTLEQGGKPFCHRIIDRAAPAREYVA